jgi:hypothetical protein
VQYSAFCGSAYTSQSILADCEDTVNWYVESLESPNAKTRKALYPTPGFTSFASVKDIGGRALATMNARTFAVMGGQVYEVFTTQLTSAYGDVTQDNNMAQFAFNGVVGNQALISSGSNGYCLALGTNTLTQVLTGKATQVGMLDGFGIAFDNSTGKIGISAVNDVTSWDPTQFAQRSAAPDTWKAMVVNPPDIWLIGSLSGDVWYDAGSFPFPFAPRTGLNFKYGIIAPFSLVAAGYSVIWLSQTPEGTGIVVRTVGYAPRRFSDYAVEAAIANYALTSTIADAEGMVYQDQGHTWYVLRFPTANATWVADLETGEWHRRGYWNPSLNRYDAWKPRVHTFAFGQHLTADASTGMIAVMSINNPTELDGTAIRRLRQAPGPFSEHRPIPIRRQEYYMEAGTSLQTGQGSNATIMHRTSDDGGRTFSTERDVSLGLVGKYRALIRLNQLGVPHDRVNQLTVSDPLVSWRIVDAYINNDAPTGQR